MWEASSSKCRNDASSGLRRSGPIYVGYPVVSRARLDLEVFRKDVAGVQRLDEAVDLVELVGELHLGQRVAQAPGLAVELAGELLPLELVEQGDRRVLAVGALHLDDVGLLADERDDRQRVEERSLADPAQVGPVDQIAGVVGKASVLVHGGWNAAEAQHLRFFSGVFSE